MTDVCSQYRLQGGRTEGGVRGVFVEWWWSWKTKRELAGEKGVKKGKGIPGRRIIMNKGIKLPWGITSTVVWIKILIANSHRALTSYQALSELFFLIPTYPSKPNPNDATPTNPFLSSLHGNKPHFPLDLHSIWLVTFISLSCSLVNKVSLIYCICLRGLRAWKQADRCMFCISLWIPSTIPCTWLLLKKICSSRVTEWMSEWSLQAVFW